MKRIILLLLLCISTLPFAFCQVKLDVPNWITDFNEIEGNSSRIVVVKEEYGRTVEIAEQKALQTLINKECRNGEDYRIIDKYITYNSDRSYAYCYLFAQVCKKNKKCNDWEHVELNTTKYPFSGRCFVPGMAQIYKGSAGKGGAIIAAEIVGVAGIVTSFSLSTSNFTAASMSTNGNRRNDLNRIGNMWQNIGYGSIAFTVAMYIYNVIDGAVAPGKKHHQVGAKAYDLSFAPVVSLQGDYGFAARINF